MKILIGKVIKKGKEYTQADCSLGQFRRKYLVPATVYQHLSGADVEIAIRAWATKRVGQAMANPQPKVVRAPKGQAKPKGKAIAALSADDKQGMTFNRFWAEVYVRSFDKKPTTLQTYRKCWEIHLAPLLGEMRVAEFKGEHVKQVAAYLNAAIGTDRWGHKTGPLSLKSKNLVKQTLSSVCNMIRDCEYGHPPRIPTPAPPRAAKIARAEWYSETQLAALVGAATELGTNQLLFVLLGADAGLRAGEILELQWSDLDFDAQLIRVARTTATVDGVRIQQSPKGGVETTVPMTDRLASNLSAAKATSRSPYVLADGKEPFERESSNPFMKQITRRAKRTDDTIEITARSHRLRKTMAVRVANGTKNAYAVKEALRHSSLEQSAAYVLSPYESTIRDALNS